MKKTYILFTILLAITFVLSSCFEDEEALSLPSTAGDTQIGIAQIGENATYQIFYNLADNSVAKTTVFDTYDIGFSCSDTSWNIRLNNSRLMSVGNTFNTNFEDVKSPSGLNMIFDKSNGNPDSLALGYWADYSSNAPVSRKYVYVVNRGYNADLSSAGYKKIQLLSPENNKYKIKVADLNGNNEQLFEIEKDISVNFIWLSFDTGIVNIEPKKDSWSILFTIYQTMYADLNGNLYPYGVRGALLNPNNVSANVDTTNSFDEITLEIAQNTKLKTESDIIGFDWKYYNFDDNYYSIVQDKSYIVKNNDGYLYKLRFIDYYNDDNQKGYPKFEFKRL